MPDMYPMRSTVPESVTHVLRLLGANNANPTIEEGTLAGVAATRTGEGAYRLTFSESPGTFVGMWVGFGAATPGDLKGYTAVADTPFDTTNLRMDFVVYDSSFSAADITAAQYAYVFLTFKRTGLTS